MNYNVFNNSVDSILADLNKKINQLKKLTEIKRKEAHEAETIAMNAHAEANKAERIHEKLSNIIQ